MDIFLLHILDCSNSYTKNFNKMAEKKNLKLLRNTFHIPTNGVFPSKSTKRNLLWTKLGALFILQHLWYYIKFKAICTIFQFCRTVPLRYASLQLIALSHFLLSFVRSKREKDTTSCVRRVHRFFCSFKKLCPVRIRS